MSASTPAQTQTISESAADWAQSVTFAQFNPALGTLESVAISLTADVNGVVWVESLEATPAKVAAWFTGPVEVEAPSGVPMLTVTPEAAGAASLAAFDGTIDAAGPSGTVLGGLGGTVSAQGSYVPNATDLAAFVGTGTVSLQAVSDITVNEAGPANLWAASGALADATIGLQYDYVPAGGGSSGSSGGSGFTFINLTVPGSWWGSVTTTTQVRTVADRTTGWNDTVTVSQFDPTLGTLEAVNVTLVGNIAATVGMENLGTTPGTASFGAQASVSLAAAAGGPALVTASPAATDSATLPGFDGTANFAGPSGRYDQGLTGSDTETVQLTTSAELAAFTGTGTVALDVGATGGSTGEAPANFVTYLKAAAGAEVEVSYTYLPADPPCFAAGTRLRTDRGEIDVARLRPGDRVVTYGGVVVPIRWVGSRRVDVARHPRPWDVAPVRIDRDAFAPGQPARTLLLSPDHAVFVDGVLMPVRYLLNGATIRRANPPHVTYWHVELARHDVLLAEGLPAETYLDTGNRAAFAGERVMALHPDFARAVWQQQGCAPLVTDGPALAAVRRRLLDRAAALGFRLTEDADPRLRVAGQVLRPVREGERLVFALPRGATRARLLSRSAVPAEVRAVSADHRRLGIAVAQLAAHGAVPVAVTPQEGWYAPEPGWRWTDGDAALALHGAVERLELRLLPLLSYWQPPAARPGTSRPCLPRSRSQAARGGG